MQTASPTADPPVPFWVARWVAPVAAVIAVVMVPWSVGLGVVLSPTTVARHWDLAWVGLDGTIAVTMGFTAWRGFQRDPRMAFGALVTGTLLLVDAWFDVCTSAAGMPLVIAITMALCVEVPLAAGFLLLARAVGRAALVPRTRTPAADLAVDPADPALVDPVGES